jgi:hypothetical protein
MRRLFLLTIAGAVCAGLIGFTWANEMPWPLPAAFACAAIYCSAKLIIVSIDGLNAPSRKRTRAFVMLGSTLFWTLLSIVYVRTELAYTLFFAVFALVSLGFTIIDFRDLHRASTNQEHGADNSAS